MSYENLSSEMALVKATAADFIEVMEAYYGALQQLESELEKARQRRQGNDKSRPLTDGGCEDPEVLGYSVEPVNENSFGFFEFKRFGGPIWERLGSSQPIVPGDRIRLNPRSVGGLPLNPDTVLPLTYQIYLVIGGIRRCGPYYLLPRTEYMFLGNGNFQAFYVGGLEDSCQEPYAILEDVEGCIEVYVLAKKKWERGFSSRLLCAGDVVMVCPGHTGRARVRYLFSNKEPELISSNSRFILIHNYYDFPRPGSGLKSFKFILDILYQSPEFILGFVNSLLSITYVPFDWIALRAEVAAAGFRGEEHEDWELWNIEPSNGPSAHEVVGDYLWRGLEWFGIDDPREDPTFEAGNTAGDIVGILLSAVGLVSAPPAAGASAVEVVVSAQGEIAIARVGASLQSIGSALGLYYFIGNAKDDGDDEDQSEQTDEQTQAEAIEGTGVNESQASNIADLVEENEIDIHITGRLADTPTEIEFRTEAYKRAEKFASENHPDEWQEIETWLNNPEENDISETSRKIWQNVQLNVSESLALEGKIIDPHQIKISSGKPEVDVFIPKEQWDSLTADQQDNIRRQIAEIFGLTPDEVDFYQEIRTVPPGWPDPTTHIPAGSIGFIYGPDGISYNHIPLGIQQ